MIYKPELREGRVVIRHDDEDYGPWVVEADRPRGFKAALKVLRGRYEPTLGLTRRLTVKGTGKMLKSIYTPGIRELLNSESHLFKDDD